MRRGKVTILGGGAAGINAAKMAIGLGGQVTILDIDPERLLYLADVFGNSITTLMSTPDNIQKSVVECDLLVSTVLLTGGKAPILVNENLVASMEKGSAIVDVAIDQGGSIATIKPTTHDDPIYQVHGVTHYGVTNMPGNVPVTSTYALTNATIKYALELANKGYARAMSQSLPLALGLNTYQGHVTHKAVAEALRLEYKEVRF